MTTSTADTITLLQDALDDALAEQQRHTPGDYAPHGHAADLADNVQQAREALWAAQDADEHLDRAETDGWLDEDGYDLRPGGTPTAVGLP